MIDQTRKIIGVKQFEIVLKRLSYALLENHSFQEESVLVGLQPRGVMLLNSIVFEFQQLNQSQKIQKAYLDHTFFRDDFRAHDQILMPKDTQVDFEVENKKIVLVDDVLYTGRSVRSGIESLLTLGRPKSIELLVMVDRRFHRELPITPNYVGVKVDALGDEKVTLKWQETNPYAEVFISR